MYYYIKGEKVMCGDGFVVIDAGGVGYKISTSNTTLSTLADGVVTVYTYLAVREDAMELYGFATNTELKMFRLLMSVTGIGPKAALAVLSAMTVNTLTLAVMTDDATTITKAPGIGAKTAKRIILELKDKLGASDILPAEITPESISQPLGDNFTEAAAALTALGYSANEAHSALIKLDKSLSTEDMIKEALKSIR